MLKLKKRTKSEHRLGEILSFHRNFLFERKHNYTTGSTIRQLTLTPYFINVGEWIQVKTVTNKCNYRLLRHSQFTRKACFTLHFILSVQESMYLIKT